MCRQVIKSCNYERLLPRLAQPRALILTGNAWILHPLTAAPSRRAGGDAQGSTDPTCEGSGPRTRLPKPRLWTNGATGSPEHAKTPQHPPGPSARAGPAAPEGSAARAATPGRGAALSLGPQGTLGVVVLARLTAPAAPHRPLRPPPSARPELTGPWAPRHRRCPGIRRTCPGPQPLLPVPRLAAAFRFLRAAPLGARSPAALFTTVPAPSPRRTPAAGTGRCATAAA